MKNKTACILICLLTAALVFFTCGFFSGRAARGVTIRWEKGEPAAVSSESAENTDEDDNSPESAPEDETPASSEETTPGEEEQTPHSAGVVNINTAQTGELQTLPGIGEVIAGRIIEYRNANGPFASVEDICNVKGIGQAKFEGMKDLICVD